MKIETPSKKRGLKILLWIVGIIIVLALLGSLGAKTESTPQASTQPDVTAEPAAPATPNTWVKVAELSGTTNKRGDVFKINSTKQRITYTVSDQHSPFVSVYLIPEGKSLERDGGFPEVMMATTSGETLAYKSAGSYYLDVNGQDEWTVIVEEWK
ncbi:hypothetical protein QM806_04505 [Rhodococcus sp. IEGM 1351]|uniref:hypothetical protein n=1 Tax=Rhodococcus sp. IEGM 1351 TaxID=3047089 RepID=UPI0024B8372A|nr:hypothetical protein [Rhodococcus sp. IEGM 1351]MDI9934716.1 hypothetical protein [Rhodococcus sp. IEGM 1351]